MFIAGDWGTSHLRLTLCDDQGHVHERTEGLGAAEAAGEYAGILEKISRPWREQRGELNVVLAGMVGSAMGWAETPYLNCPLVPLQIAHSCTSPQGMDRVQIIPGIRCQNRFGAPDVMRGEETQILGALSLHVDLRRGRQLLGLPGTHCKWVLLRDGEIAEFISAPSGEIFEALRDHTVLVGGRNRANDPVSGASFLAGLQQYNKYPDAQLLQRLFECRSRRLSGELTEEGAAGYLSGLIVASDVIGALSTFEEGQSSDEIHLIGNPTLTDLYAQAIQLHGRAVVKIDGAAASVAGLTQVHAQLIERGVLHAAH